LTETLATTSAVLGHMQWKREGQSRQIALPLLTLGLRREPDGQRRFYCTSVYGKCWEPHEELGNSFKLLARPSEDCRAHATKLRECFAWGNAPRQVGGLQASVRLQGWLSSAVVNWEKGMRNRTRDAYKNYPSGF